MVFKIDFEKAYDCVEWDVACVRVSVLVNGSTGE